VRPAITGYPRTLKYNQVFTVTFTVGTRTGVVDVVMNSSPFSTHSYSQGQRQAKLKASTPVRAGTGWSAQSTTPSSANALPPSYYMFFVVQNNIPSRGVWVRLGF
jgi:hypothetical protein